MPSVSTNIAQRTIAVKNLPVLARGTNDKTPSRSPRYDGDLLGDQGVSADLYLIEQGECLVDRDIAGL